MHIDRKVNESTGAVELWHCEWEYPASGAAKKTFVAKIGEEQGIDAESQNEATEEQAICWGYGRTVGNIAVTTPSILGQFSARTGQDALLPCDFVEAGKFRNGKDRWWCRTHQVHWGTIADFKSLELSGQMYCGNRDQLMHYVLSPPCIDTSAHAEIGVWCSMPAALSSWPIKSRRPKIHVHVRDRVSGPKTIDRDYKAVSLLYTENLGMFASPDITRVNLTPPAAFDFVCSLEEGREMSCINCNRCQYPHLDLGEFAKSPHRKHFCGNCGWDSTWSRSEIVSTPLKTIHDQLLGDSGRVIPDRTLNMDDYADCTYNVWASTPAILWTNNRPQEVGIHVHMHRGKERVVDETFATVVFQGEELDRSKLFDLMVDNIDMSGDALPST
jgi:hypothetical protein